MRFQNSRMLNAKSSGTDMQHIYSELQMVNTKRHDVSLLLFSSVAGVCVCACVCMVAFTFCFVL